MKLSSLPLPIVVAGLLVASVFTIATAAQAPQTAPEQNKMAGGPPPGGRRMAPPPTNLKVLPKDMTGDQVHKIMDGWEGALGVHCDTCHAVDPKNIGPNGRPRLNFADDSKQEKSTARLMFTMTEGINKNTISMVDEKAAPVTCGTCHRGHLKPEPFVAPPDEHDGPRPGQGPMQNPQPAGADMPQAH